MNRIYNNVLAALLVVFILAMILILGGCMTTYSINKTNVDGTSITITIKSFREFEQPKVHYDRNGEIVNFTFGAASATTAASPIEQAFADVLRQGGTIGAALVTPPGVQ